METIQVKRSKTSTSEILKMNAAITPKYGGPEVFKIVQLEKPKPKENEVLVKIYAASVTAADTFMRKGDPYLGRLFVGLTKPKEPIPGTGFSGVIEAIGSKVINFEPGDEVFGESIFASGTNAEYVCVPQDGIITQKPKNITFAAASNICDGAVTSMNFLQIIANIQPEQNILINGASGSLGTAAIQIAKYFGANVTGVCSEKNIELVKSLGADHTINYNERDFTKAKNTYDIIYDAIGTSSFKKCKNALTKNGQYISPVLHTPLLFQMIFTTVWGNKKAKFSATGLKSKSDIKLLLEAVVSLIESNKLTVNIDKIYPLHQITAAHQYVDSGRKKGNIALVMNTN